MLLRAGCLNLIGNYVNSFDKAFIIDRTWQYNIRSIDVKVRTLLAPEIFMKCYDLIWPQTTIITAKRRIFECEYSNKNAIFQPRKFL